MEAKKGHQTKKKPLKVSKKIYQPKKPSWDTLPTEVLTNLCGFLSLEDLQHMSVTSKRNFIACKNALLDRYQKEFFEGKHTSETWAKKGVSDEVVIDDIRREDGTIGFLQLPVEKNQIKDSIISQIDFEGPVITLSYLIKMNNYPTISRQLIDKGYRKTDIYISQKRIMEEEMGSEEEEEEMGSEEVEEEMGSEEESYFSEENLRNLPLRELRNIARELGITPTGKSKKELISDIIAVTTD